MKSLALLFAVACSGCFSTWAVTQASGRSLAWDEQPREETVPMPASEERLTIAMPLQGELALSCKSTQQARETVYRSSFRYGSGWKKATALGFVTEALLGTALYIAGQHATDSEDHGMSSKLAGGFFAVDAIGTAALFFVPRKDKFSRSERDSSTPLRKDCPEGLTLEIAGNTFAVDAAGRIGDAGEVALDDWMKAPTGALLVGFAGRTTELRVSDAEQCSWLVARDPMHACKQRMYPTMREAYATIGVPVGTLTALAE
ncbi:MAG TPA: hypothetical protein VIV40_21005 [Kofleriaceae bacterium]